MSAYLSAMWEGSRYSLTDLRLAVLRYRKAQGACGPNDGIDPKLTREQLFEELSERWHQGMPKAKAGRPWPAKAVNAMHHA